MSNLLTDELTQKEILILVMLAKGYTAKEIGARWETTEDSSYIWLRAMRQKLGAKTNEQAVAMAIVSGIIE